MSNSPKGHGNLYTLGFVFILCACSALILALLSSALSEDQESAKKLDRSKQMLIAAKIYHPAGYFLIPGSKEGDVLPAKWDGKNLVADETKTVASDATIAQVYNARIHAFLVDANGERSEFESKEAETSYTEANKKLGYAKLPKKLIYEINDGNKGIAGFVIPANGYGLWGTIYGYIALKTDGKTVIGISWYEHGETPGLGAVISEYAWQSQFTDKSIVMLDAKQGITFDNSPIGITVVRGKVKEAITDPLKQKSAVDGISGATLTGNGVTKAYKDCLGPYRPFLKALNAATQGTK